MQENLYQSEVHQHSDHSISKSELRKRNTQKLIKNALFLLIEENEFGEISVEDICAEAKVVRKTFYNHFTDKRDVLQALSLDITLSEGTTNTYQIISDYATSAERIAAMFRTQHQRILRYGIGRKKVLQAQQQHSSSTRYNTLKQGFERSLQDLFKSGQELGDVCTDITPQFLAQITYAALTHTINAWIEDESFDLAENERQSCLYLQKVVKPE